ncbi:hypothetical protein BDR07DRAFT_344551 [Suillus spraguei]|nr:hypothetical protein BDR07DRAFT_344551 [Suillus spraguei]
MQKKGSPGEDEKVHEMKQLGDLIGLRENAGRILARWGLHEKLRDVSSLSEELHIHDYLGGVPRQPKPSGYAIYRAWFDAEECGVTIDPLTDFMSIHGDQVYAWIGKDICWLITHKDDAAVDGNWSSPGKIEDVLDIVKDWDLRCAQKLLRVSTGSFLYTTLLLLGLSGRISSDGLVLAVALSLAGIPLGTRTWESIRYQRVRNAQVMGVTTRDKWHGAKPGDSGESFELPMPEWLVAFDAEADAYATYDEVARSIVEDGYRRPTPSGEESTVQVK